MADRYFLAGHRGMVGSAIHRQLRAQGVPEDNILTRTHAALDLTDQAATRTSIAPKAGIKLEFQCEGVAETGTVTRVTSNSAPAVAEGDVIVRVDPRYFRPAEVETLLGDPSRAKARLGWEPQITAREMCAEMVAEDLRTARRHALLKEHGLELPMSLET